MRVLTYIFCLCAFIPLAVWSATITKSVQGGKLKEQSSATDGKVEKKAKTVATDVTSASKEKEVDFVSGEDVANFSGKTQDQIFNQIVPLANVKDFYDHHHPHNHEYWDYRHYFNHPHPHRHYSHNSDVHHYKHKYHHSHDHETTHHHEHTEPKTIHHQSKHIYHQSIHKPDKVHYHKHRYHVHKDADHDYETKHYHHKEPSHYYTSHEHKEPSHAHYYYSQDHQDGHHEEPVYHHRVTAPAIHDDGFHERKEAFVEEWDPKWEPKWEQKSEPEWEPKFEPEWRPTKYGSKYRKTLPRPNPKQHVDWLAMHNAAKTFDDGQYRSEHHLPKSGWKQRRANKEEELGELKSFDSNRDATGNAKNDVKDLKDWAETLAAAKAAAGKAPWREENDWQIDAGALQGENKWQNERDGEANKWQKRDNEGQYGDRRQNQNKWQEKGDAPAALPREAEVEAYQGKEADFRNADYYFDERVINEE